VSRDENTTKIQFAFHYPNFCDLQMDIFLSLPQLRSLSMMPILEEEKFNEIIFEVFRFISAFFHLSTRQIVMDEREKSPL
jgi:hypothetical protein